MLWCIPVFLFMFLVYYAVSALTGLVWKSPIISVVVTVLFWIACFVVDLTHERDARRWCSSSSGSRGSWKPTARC